MKYSLSGKSKGIVAAIVVVTCLIVLLVTKNIGYGLIAGVLFGILAFAIAIRIYRGCHYKLTSSIAEEMSKGEQEIAWDVYPRPQLRRSSFYSLNGIWRLNGKDILIPFPPEASLSGYKGKVRGKLIYEREFQVPKEYGQGQKLLLHFGAVDQTCSVYVDDRFVGANEGGYIPFEIDITDAVTFDSNTSKSLPSHSCTHRLKVVAKDNLSTKYPYGKQCKRRGGMWYTPVSGIWQTVWMEVVPEIYISRVKITPLDVDVVKLEWELSGGKAAVNGTISYEGKPICGFDASADKTEQIIDFSKNHEVKLWTPDNPSLYSLKLKTSNDEVESYFAMRIASIEDVDGYKRFCLNHEPVFLNGVLDQGYYCDGLFLPASPEGYKQDILEMKELGFNTLRKHIKLEPELFYYYCDKYGMLVMQDMVNNGRYHFIKDTVAPTYISKDRRDRSLLRKKTGAWKGTQKVFIEQSKKLIDIVYNHPSVIAYTVFNEGWGQFDSDQVGNLLKQYDKTRPYDYTSGWFAQKDSDFDSHHIYFSHKPPVNRNVDKCYIISEFGGYSYRIGKHLYSKYNKYGYGEACDSKGYGNMINEVYSKLIESEISKGLSGCIYTQLSDVEDETNGLLTYDRKVCKINQDILGIKSYNNSIN